MQVCETERLVIRHFEPGDTDYILRQLNEESFIRFIADKQVRTLSDASQYLQNGPMASYTANGFGLNMVLLKSSGEAVGMCGLVKREELGSPDLGYAILPEHWRKGYALEAGAAVLDDARQSHSLNTVLGVTLPDNLASNQLLLKLGFSLTGSVELYGDINNLYEYRIRA